jgi:hypothetical protein
MIEKIAYQENKVYINKSPYFDAVSHELWAFPIGGLLSVSKWIKAERVGH